MSVKSKRKASESKVNSDKSVSCENAMSPSVLKSPLKKKPRCSTSEDCNAASDSADKSAMEIPSKAKRKSRKSQVNHSTSFSDEHTSIVLAKELPSEVRKKPSDSIHNNDLSGYSNNSVMEPLPTTKRKSRGGQVDHNSSIYGENASSDRPKIKKELLSDESYDDSSVDTGVIELPSAKKQKLQTGPVHEKMAVSLNEKKVFDAKQFIKRLKSPDAEDAVTQWLALISGKTGTIQKTEESISSVVSKEVDGSKSDEEDEHEEKNSTSGVKVEVDETADESNEGNAGKIEGACDTPDKQKNGGLGGGVRFIDTFLRARGSVSDILHSLPSPENNKPKHMKNVFKVVSKVLLRICAEHEELIDDSVGICKTFLNSYTEYINTVLTQKSWQDTIFDLLTALVTLDSDFGVEILNVISLDKAVVEDVVAPGSFYGCRHSYLKFLVALIIEKNDHLIFLALQKPWLFNVVWEHIKYDQSDVIVLLLMALKEAVLENKSISKTSKQSLFFHDTIINLLSLYKWKSPANRPTSVWNEKSKLKKPKLLAEVDSSEADLVAAAVHEFLLVLLADFRRGIIFSYAVVDGVAPHNKVVWEVLKRIDQPWQHEKVAELVSKTLAACPDALSLVLNELAPYMKPRSSPKWFTCAKFLGQVIEIQQPEVVLQYQLSSSLKAVKLAYAAMEMCIPLPTLQALTSNHSAVLHMQDMDVANCTINLIVCMLGKIMNFKAVLWRWAHNSLIDHAKAQKCQNTIITVLSQSLPTLDSIQKSWNCWTDKYKNISDDSTEKPIEILSGLIKLLKMYKQLSHDILKSFDSQQSELKLSMTNFVSETAHLKDTAQLRIDLYQLLVEIGCETFSLENESAREPLCTMFCDMVNSSTTVSSVAWSVLISLIRPVKDLEGFDGEVELWLSVYKEKFFEKGDMYQDIGSMLVDGLFRFNKSPLKYLDIIAQSEQNAAAILYESGVSVFSLIDVGTLDKLFEDSEDSSRFGNLEFEQPSSCMHQQNVGTLSPWLPAFLESLLEHASEKRLKKQYRKVAEEFCYKLIFHLLCRLPYPEVLHSLLNKYTKIVPKKLSDYVSSWLSKGNPPSIDADILGENSIEVKLHSLIFCCNDDVTFLSDQFHKLLRSHYPAIQLESEYRSCKRSGAFVPVSQLVHFICFHLTQLARLQKLTKDVCDNSQALLFVICDIASKVDKQTESGENDLLAKCLKVVFSYPIMYEQFNPLAKENTISSLLLTEFLRAMSKKSSSCSSLHDSLEPFKKKLLAAVRKAIGEKKKNLDEDVVLLVDAFPLSFQDVSELLVLISDLPVSYIVGGSEEVAMLSQWGSLAARLLSWASECRVQGNNNTTDVIHLPASVISQVAVWLETILLNENCDLTLLVEGFVSYMKSCPQQICHIRQKRLLSCLLRAKKTSVALCQLVELLASSLDSLITFKLPTDQILPETVPAYFALLRAKMNKKIPGKKQFEPLFTAIRGEVRKAVSKFDNHPEWLASNIDGAVYLMQAFMQDNERDNLCKALEAKVPSLTKEKLYFIQFVIEVLREHPGHLLFVLLAWLGASLRKQESSFDQECLVMPLCQAVIKLLKEQSFDDFSTIKDSRVWQDGLKLFIKVGLGVAKFDTEGSKKRSISDMDRNMSCLLLQTLTLLFQKMYSPEERHRDILMAYKMIEQHSEFLNIMIGSLFSKLELVQLLFVVFKKRPDLMSSSFAPVLLSAYHATLAKTDRELLRIIMLFEQHKVDLSHYRPFYWGYRASTHYGVSALSSQASSLRLQSSPKNILALLIPEKVIETIEKFPIHSTLRVTENETPCDTVYDPSFYLPLFIHLFSSESSVNPYLALNSGALALCFASLSSFDAAVRAAAYTALARFVSLLQSLHGKYKMIITHFMTAVQRGVSAYEGPNPRLPSVVSVFLAQCSMVLNTTEHPLHRTLTEFVVAKPEMNLQTVPNILCLLYSTQTVYLEHRHWILKVLCNGLKSPIDFKICLQVVPVCKFLLSLYTSCMCDSKSQVLILSFLQSAVAIPYGARCLIKSYGLTSWLHQTILNLKTESRELVTGVVKLLCALWNSLSLPLSQDDDPEAGCVNVRVVHSSKKNVLILLIALYPKLARVGEAVLEQYIMCLDNVMKSLDATSMITKDTLRSIIQLSLPFCNNKREFFELLDLGVDHIDLTQTFNPNVTNLRASLRSLIVHWFQCRKAKRHTDNSDDIV